MHDRRSDGYSPPAPAEPSLVLDSGERALQCLISGATPQGECTSLMETILSSEKATDMVDRLGETDAQTFVNVVDEVRSPSPTLNGFALNSPHLDRRWRVLTWHHVSEGNA